MEVCVSCDATSLSGESEISGGDELPDQRRVEVVGLCDHGAEPKLSDHIRQVGLKTKSAGSGRVHEACGEDLDLQPCIVEQAIVVIPDSRPPTVDAGGAPD